MMSGWPEFARKELSASSTVTALALPERIISMASSSRNTDSVESDSGWSARQTRSPRAMVVASRIYSEASAKVRISGSNA
ncbi:MAG: hypothetical protein WCK85_05695 [Chlorobium sp.]